MFFFYNSVYAENGDLIRAKNKAYYYKTKFGLSSDDMKKYDVHLVLIVLILAVFVDISAISVET